MLKSPKNVSMLVALMLLTSIFSYGQAPVNNGKLDKEQINQNRDLKVFFKETMHNLLFKNDGLNPSEKESFSFYYNLHKRELNTDFKSLFDNQAAYTKDELVAELKNLTNGFLEKFKNANFNGGFDMSKFKVEKDNNHSGHNHDEVFGPGDPCTNSDFEMCDFTNWDLTQGDVDANAYGYVNEVSVGPGTGSASDQHFIVNPGMDPVVNTISMIPPNGGTCSVQLGDGTGTGGRAAKISQTFLVDINSANFTYQYAAILEDPAGHTLGEKPYFIARVYDQNGDELVCGTYNATAGDGQAGWVNNGTVQYKDWTTVFVPLQAYIGQNVTVEFTVGDCSQSGHYGYAYVEANCAPGEILGPDTITCDGPITISAPDGADSYLWNTGETTQSITVSTPGTYDVDVIPVTGPACAINLTKDVYEFVDTVEAIFSINPDTICVGQSISFTESSVVTGLGNIVSWDWDFDGDGNVDLSTQNPPDQVYNTAGTYDITLTAATQGCTDDTTIQVVVEPSATANFTAPSVCLGQATNFTDGSSVGVNNWSWDFDGDGNEDSNTQNPTYNFTAPGTYPVNLEISIDGACAMDTTIDVVVNPNPVAEFSTTDVCLTTVANFTDQSSISSGAITNWDWNFDDGGATSTDQNPTYTYGGSGTYDVQLTVTSDSNCVHDTIIPINVYDNPVADFTSDAVCENLISTLTDASTIGSIDIENWSWDFDNDLLIDNTNQNPTNNFGLAGTYPVSLAIVDSNGCTDTIVQNVTVSPNPTALFTFSNECFGAATDFTDLSNGNGGTIDTWNWDFQDNGTVDNNSQNPSNGYSSAGVFSAELYVETTDGCKDSIVVNVDVDPIPLSNFSGNDVCFGFTTNFIDSSEVSTGNVEQWSWDFGDGLGTSIIQNPTYDYNVAGQYDVTLTATSDSGCINTVTIPVEVHNNPIANFTPDTVCAANVSSFMDVTTIGGTSIETWDWDFDNDAIADDNVQNPNYVFPGAGTFPVSLTVVDSFGCTHSVTNDVYVSEKPLANFSFSDECFGGNTALTDLSQDNGGMTPIDAWYWDYNNDGVVDNTIQNPSNLFVPAGDHSVELMVESTLGCRDSILITVDVDPIPIASFIGTSVCFGDDNVFTDNSSVSNGNINQWEWDFGDGSPIDNNQNTTHSYASDGAYNVTLTIYSDSGCTSNVVIPVNVYAVPTANFDTTDVCLNVAAQFTDQSVGNGGVINEWNWDFENDGVVDDNNQDPNQFYPAAGTYNVELQISTQDGCVDSLVKSVTIHPMPVAEFTFLNACFMDSVEFTDNSSVSTGVIDQWDWDFGNGQSSTNQHPSMSYLSEGVYNVELIVNTENNCADTVEYANIEVYPLPEVDFGPTAVCLGVMTEFQDYSTVSNNFTNNTIDAWDWNFGDGIGVSNDQNPIYAYTTDGVFDAVLILTTNNNCVDSAVLPVTVHPLPEVDFTADTTNGCADLGVNFIDQTTINSGTIQSWEWDYNGDGATDAGGPNPNFVFTNGSHSSVQMFDISLVVTSNFGCKDSVSKANFIEVYPVPLASFSFSPNESTIVDTEIEFTDQSIIAANWLWDLGDGTTTTVQHPIHEYADTGYYLVSLYMENEYQCRDTSQKYVNIDPIYAIWIPNAFTPDGDFVNDFFYVDGYGLKEIQVKIFDRWGLKLYDEIGLDQTWDGKYKGEIVPTDVYVYKIRVKDIFDEWHDYIGKVTVIK